MLRFKGIFSLLLVLFAGLSMSVNAQIYDPVDWTISYNTIDDETGEIVLKATIEEHWHLYAINMTDDPEALGPQATEITYSSSSDYELVGKTTESKPIHLFDPVFEIPLNFFENSATFKQKIKRKSDKSFKITATVYYMACDDSKCTPPTEEDYVVTVPAKAAAGAKAEPAPAKGEANAQESAPEATSTSEEPEQSSPVTAGSQAQGGIQNPVKWEIRAEAAVDGNYSIIFTADVEEGWHIYAQKLDSDMGPIPTSFFFEPAEGVNFAEGVEEGTPIRHYDPNFMMDLDYFEGRPEFTKKLSFQGENPPKVYCSVEFMVCNDEMCLPPDLVEFEVDLATGKGGIKGAAAQGPSIEDTGIIPHLPALDLANPVNSCGEVQEVTDVWTVFFFGFIGGLIALLTPCVFPMIPLTVSFFTKGGKDKKGGIQQALLYGFFIFLIYALLSVPFHFGTDPQELNAIATGATLNIIFFVVFVVFAISFFGYFEITLPNSFVNKVDNASNVGGLLGIFFMALTLALVSFSCTGPILGTVLGNSLKNGPWPVTAAMSGFGLALGLPFAVFAAFPQWLHSMPKSGGWLNTVKVVLGFLELALALKFLSNADLVYQWGLLQRETFFLIWAVIGLGLAAYLFGIIRFPHDSKGQKIGVGRKVFATAILAFSIYLIPGVMKESPWNHNLLSGFPPPTFYSWYEEKKMDEGTFHPEYSDFEEARKVAIETGKPILIDFTGWACVNCRKMEETVWTEPQIKAMLMEDFVVVSLYVDDRVELPTELQGVFEYEVNGEKQVKKIRTIGNKWATFQTHSFNNNSQPYYVMLSAEGHLLGNPVGYTPQVSEYEEYLRCGISAHKSLSSTAVQ